jgi:hypothetical protein
MAPMRPYQTGLQAPPAVATERVAHAMSTDADLAPAWVDTSHGSVFGPWKVDGAGSAVTLLPPGEKHWWTVFRYRAFVRPADPAWRSSVVFVDEEKIQCDAAAFRVDARNVWGSCQPVAEIDANEQGRLDQKATALAAALGR